MSGFGMIIGDTTDLPPIHTAGYVPRDYASEGVASSPYAVSFNEPTFDRDTWQERIEERQRKKETNRDLADLAGWTPKYQGMTNSCWAGSMVQAMEFAEVLKTGKVDRLSISSVAGPVKGFRNWRGRPAGLGGWNRQAADYAAQHGVARESVWPGNDLNPKHDNERSRQDRKQNMLLEYVDLEPQNIDMAVTLLLSGFVIGAAFMWMSHAVTLVDPVWTGREGVGFLCANTGYLRDRDGWTVLQGRRAIPDEMIAVRSVS